MATELPKGYGIDETSSERVDEGFELHSYPLGGTTNDENEMRVLGRTQQLNVRIAGVTLMRPDPLTLCSGIFVLSLL
jgi:hypothetical protein